MSKSRKSALWASAASLAAVVALLMLLAASAQAYEHVEPGFEVFEVTPSTTQAGGHPDVQVTFSYRQDAEAECTSECRYGRRVGVHWPAGFIGNPHVTPRCSLSEFNTYDCPSDAQVGKFSIQVTETIGLYVPVYNMQTRPNQAGLLGFVAPLLNFPIFLELSGRTNSDYGLDAISSPQTRLPFKDYEMELWGVPAEARHDVDRFYTPLTALGACYIGLPGVVGCPPGSPFGSATYAPPTAPPAPFLQNPTTCGVPLTVTGEVEYYDGQTATADYPWPATTGCNQASFTPSVVAKPTTSSTDTPSGIDADLKVPQTQSPITPAPSELHVARVTLPEGFSINTGAADGKVACPETLTAIGTLLAASCPEDAKIGTATINDAALPEPIPGALYLAEPKPGEPYRVLLTASGFATNVKLLGSVETNPRTGQVSMVFRNLPQTPLQEFNLHIFGSERGLLATPTQCGTYYVESEFVPWNTALATRVTKNAVTVDSGPAGTACPNGARPFSPQLQAGVDNNTAGSHTTFSVVLNRNDGEQNLTALTIKAPRGFAATLKGVPYCSEAAIASLASTAHTGRIEQSTPACPAASRVGTVVAGGGAGDHPLYVPGKVYLAGPYKGSPLSLVVVVPAVSGPYDLGNIAVRAAIDVNPVTAQVTATSDSFPQILEGIPLRTRSVLIKLDRPGFALNPTNCEAEAVEGTVHGSEGATTSRSNHFQVANCASLPFGPKLTLRLRGSTKRGGNPALKATLAARPGEANIGSVVVTMPHSIFLDTEHVNGPCTKVQFAANACPPGSVLGTARAESPLLAKPLEGPVYLASGYGHKLPDVVAALKGQFNVNVDGRVSSVHQRLRTSFETVPDVPVTRFTMNLRGGKRGLLLNSANLCAKKQRASVKMAGQNGRRSNVRGPLKVKCGSKIRHKRHRRHRLRSGGVR